MALTHGAESWSIVTATGQLLFSRDWAMFSPSRDKLTPQALYSVASGFGLDTSSKMICAVISPLASLPLRNFAVILPWIRMLL